MWLKGSFGINPICLCCQVIFLNMHYRKWTSKRKNHWWILSGLIMWHININAVTRCLCTRFPFPTLLHLDSKHLPPLLRALFSSFGSKYDSDIQCNGLISDCITLWCQRASVKVLERKSLNSCCWTHLISSILIPCEQRSAEKRNSFNSTL